MFSLFCGTVTEMPYLLASWFVLAYARAELFRPAKAAIIMESNQHHQTHKEQWKVIKLLYIHPQGIVPTPRTTHVIYLERKTEN